VARTNQEVFQHHAQAVRYTLQHKG